MAKFIPVEPEKWAEMVKAQAEVARLKADVNELADGLKLASEVGIKVADEVTRLKAEVERLNNESDILQKCCEHQKNRIERLKAEVERLTKAGDALAGEAIRLEYNNYWSEYEKVEDVCIDEVEAWHKAKGVQS